MRLWTFSSSMSKAFPKISAMVTCVTAELRLQSGHELEVLKGARRALSTVA